MHWKLDPVSLAVVPNKPHLVTCPVCEGAGEVLAEGRNMNDPEAPVFRCDECGGDGRVRCVDNGCCDFDPPEDQ